MCACVWHACVCVRACLRVCVSGRTILCLEHACEHSHAHVLLSALEHLLPQAIHSLKNQSLDVLRLKLSLESPSTVELFRALPQSRLKEFQFTASDSPMV